MGGLRTAAFVTTLKSLHVAQLHWTFGWGLGTENGGWVRARARGVRYRRPRPHPLALTLQAAAPAHHFSPAAVYVGLALWA